MYSRRTVGCSELEDDASLASTGNGAPSRLVLARSTRLAVDVLGMAADAAEDGVAVAVLCA
jgi:hypothetical protein